nr:hypothetical protein [Pseudomonadota bacterium]
DKVGAMPATPGIAIAAARPAGVVDDTVSALLNLGYRRPEVLPVVAKVREQLGEEAGLDALIRDSLKELAQRSTTQGSTTEA